MRSSTLLSILFLGALALSGFAAVSDYFSSSDSAALQQLINKAQSKDGSFNGNIKDTHDAVAALQQLKATIPNQAAVCAYAKTALNGDLESIYHAVSVLEALKCGEKVSDDVTKKISAGLAGDNVVNFYRAVTAWDTLQSNSHISLDSKKALVGLSSLLELLDESEGLFKLNADTDEGSAYWTGLALKTLSRLFKHADENERSQIDGVASKVGATMRNGNQLEGSGLVFKHVDGSVSPLRTTATLIEGIASYTNIVRKDKGIKEVTDAHVANIAEYLVQHKNVGTVSDAQALVLGLNSVASVRPQPLVVSLEGDSTLTDKSGDIKLRVTDLFGQTVPKATIQLTKVTTSSKKEPVVSNQKLTEKEPGLFTHNLLAAKPDAGAYTLDLSVTAPSKDYQTTSSAKRVVQVVTKIALQSIEAYLSDSTESDDKSATSRRINVDPTGRAAAPTVAVTTGQSNLHFAATLRADQGTISARQAHLKLIPKGDNVDTVTFVGKYDPKTKAYKWHINFDKTAHLFSKGEYKLELVLGDSYAENAIVLHAANLQIESGSAPPKAAASASNLLPEIKYIFAQPEKRPPATISTLFTGLTLAPLLFLLVGLMTVGANIRDFPTGVSFLPAVGFHVTFGVMLALLFQYWLSLTMFQTLYYAGALALPLIYFGNRTLRFVNEAREKKR